MPAKVELKISGLGHREMETALVNAGLVVEKKAYSLDGETKMSLVGGKVLNMARRKAGTFQHMRSGLTLRLDPNMVPPSTLSVLLALVGRH